MARRRLAEAAVRCCLSGGGEPAAATAARQATAANSSSFLLGANIGNRTRPRSPQFFPLSFSSFSSSASVASSSSSSSPSSWPPLSKIPRWWGEEEEEEEGTGGRRRSRPGPRAAKLSALPFSVSRADAERTYRAFHAAHALLPSRPPPPIRTDEALLPFWCVAAVGTVRLRGASVGFDRLERFYDPLSKTWRSELRTRWHSVRLDRSWEAEYLPDSPGMCVYASFRYAASDADAASPARGAGGETLRRGGVSVSEAVSRPAPDDYDSSTSSSSSSSQEVRRAVDPFEMPPAEAVKVALAAARAAEVSRAAAALRHEFRADRVAAVDLTFAPSSDDSSGGGVAASPLYAPAFVFIWDHYGTRVPTVVSGSAPGQVAGDRALDAARVAAAAAVASVAAMAVAGGPPAWLAGAGSAGSGGVLFGGMAANALGWALGLAAPAAAAALAAHYAPLIRARLSAAAAARGAAQSAAAAREKGWDAEWVRSGASEAADAARRRRSSSSYRSRGSFSSEEPHRPGPAGDPRRYYVTLGVPPSASPREVSAAFRGAALGAHPDRLPPGSSEAERAKASKGFREIVEAYSVLRDPGKRSKYDRGEL